MCKGPQWNATQQRKGPTADVHEKVNLAKKPQTQKGHTVSFHLHRPTSRVRGLLRQSAVALWGAEGACRVPDIPHRRAP